MSKSANDYLTESAAILGQRGSTYDRQGAERSMPRTVTAFNAITGRTGDRALTAPEGWLLLQILKDARQWSAPSFHEDSALDAVGYAALKAEELAREATAGQQTFLPEPQPRQESLPLDDPRRAIQGTAKTSMYEQDRAPWDKVRE